MALTKSLKALADDNRLRILQLLLKTDLCVGALAKHLGISEPAVSQHLRILRKAGFVKEILAVEHEHDFGRSAGAYRLFRAIPVP